MQLESFQWTFGGHQPLVDLPAEIRDRISSVRHINQNVPRRPDEHRPRRSSRRNRSVFDDKSPDVETCRADSRHISYGRPGIKLFRRESTLGSTQNKETEMPFVGEIHTWTRSESQKNTLTTMADTWTRSPRLRRLRSARFIAGRFPDLPRIAYGHRCCHQRR